MKPKQTTATADTKLTVRLADLEEKLKRTLADYDNLEKRIERERLLYITLTTTTLAAKFIEVLDDFYLANSHLCDPGLKMAIEKFNQTLKSVGVNQIEVSVGAEFDPRTMDCLEAVDGESNKIVSVLKPGYLYNDHVIRPVSVTVGKNPTSK
jgi:molecular chaperone GrpE